MTLQGSRITFHAVSFWASMAALLALACVLVVAGNSTVLWSAPIALCIFFSGSWLLMKRTQTRLTELTPLSWSLLVFFIQLVLIPLLILMSEPAVGTLRVLPSPTSINYGLLLSTFAFCAFVLGFSLRHRTELRRTHLIRAEWKPPLHIALSFIVMGLLGFYLYSVGSPSLSLLMDPQLARQVARSAETGFSEASATFLRPVFVAGLVLLWIRATHSGLCRTLP
ncbi:MAG TPA: hypothetical protein VEQ63_14580, partial [Bryobacteraceae bacterium]|nr:hypothetical protein [Bryobacteraceae bacterium]